MIVLDLKKELSGAAGPLHLDVDLNIEKGSIVALMGPSGAGKTTILKMITGILSPDVGSIKVGDEYWYDHHDKVNLAPQKRNVGYVFQDLALFPHMTIAQQMRYASPKDQEHHIKETLEMMDLWQLRDKRPSALSGGQQQRVALARAIIQRPAMLLMDEPLSALDYDIKVQMRSYIKEIHKTYGTTIILVSHDRKDVLDLCDHVYYLVEGKIIRSGKPGALSLKERARSTGIVIAKEYIQGAWMITIDQDGHQSIVKFANGEKISIGDKVTISGSLS